ncbi:MAG TPA: cysteine hydrolase [Mycobacteriales bacterium]|nr:cysteine hydrolase [Mycobacteriales bacterium]
MPQQPMIVGRPVLVVVDFQKGADLPFEEVGIEHMDGHAARIAIAEDIVAAARAAGIPIVFLQEVHRRSLIDFGRELDGNEGVHLLEGDRGTELIDSLMPRDDEYHIVKRRYSGFIGTELEIVLRALRAETLILIGGLTDVCVHYTFADAHQRDFYVRVVTDCVGGSSLARHTASLDAMEYLQHGSNRTSAEVIAAFEELAPSRTVSVPVPTLVEA